jgi:hypothetical protein
MIKLIHSRKLDGEIMKTNRTSVKTLLTRVIIGLALLAGVHPVLAQPALGIVPTNNQFILF